MPRFESKVTLVTGAARGIGLSIAESFVAEGATVVLTDIRDAEGRAAAARLGTRASYETLDVRDEPAWTRVIDALLATHGRLDVLVNNAGITGFEDGVVAHDPEHASLTAWRAVHAVNLDGTFLGCREAIRAMKRTRTGSIVNISLRSGVVGIPGAAAYASSKAAIRNHTKSVALYCAQQGWAIRCNSLHPAAILTPMWEPMLGTGATREAAMRAITADCPLQRFGRPDEVAAVAVLLASDEATYITGTEFTIDGGILAGASGAPRAAETRAER